MLARWQFNTLTALGALSLLLTLVNATLFTMNRESQAEIAQRQQYVQQSVALEGFIARSSRRWPSSERAAMTGGFSTSLRSRV